MRSAETCRSGHGSGMMSEKIGRRSIRLPDFDYSQPAAYFVTLCVEDFHCLLAQVVDGMIQLKKAGAICLNVWRSLPDRFPSVDLDRIVVMPNHLHGILLLKNEDHQPNQPFLGDVVGAFQSLVFQQYYQWIKDNHLNLKAKFWQRNYYEHVIRNDEDWERVRNYILMNPMNWSDDTYYRPS